MAASAQDSQGGKTILKKDPRVYLAQILERINRIREYTVEGKKAFFADPRTQDAVIRNFEVIGEAAKRIPDEYRKKNPTIPWRELSGLLDVLIHQYEGVSIADVADHRKKILAHYGRPSPPFFRRWKNWKKKSQGMTINRAEPDKGLGTKLQSREKRFARAAPSTRMSSPSTWSRSSPGPHARITAMRTSFSAAPASRGLCASTRGWCSGGSPARRRPRPR